MVQQKVSESFPTSRLWSLRSTVDISEILTQANNTRSAGDFSEFSTDI